MVELEDVARIRAEIERTGDRDAVLAAAGLDARGWLRAQRRWLRELAAEIETGETHLAARYCAAYLGSSPQTAPVLGTPVAVNVAVEMPSYMARTPPPWSTPVAPPAPPVAPPAPVLASTPAPGPAPSAPFAGTAMVFELPRGPATPFREGPASPAVSAPRSEDSASPPRTPLAGGTAVVFELSSRPAVPFAAETAADGAPDARSAAPAQPSTQTASKPLSGTTAPDAGLAPAGPSTPFTAAETGPFELTIQRFAELSAAQKEPGASPEEVMSRFGLSGTPFAEVDAAWKAKLKANAALTLEFHRRLTDAIQLLADRRREAAERPKRAGKTLAVPVHPGPAAASSPPAPLPPAVPGAAPPRPATPLPSPAAVAAPQSPAPGAAPPPPATPLPSPAAVAAPQSPASGAAPPPPAVVASQAPGAARSAPAPAVPELTVEQYAWVVATLRKASAPADLAQALERFRLTPDTRRQLEERWRARMAADPGLQSRFLALLNSHLRGTGP